MKNLKTMQYGQKKLFQRAGGERFDFGAKGLSEWGASVFKEKYSLEDLFDLKGNVFDTILKKMEEGDITEEQKSYLMTHLITHLGKQRPPIQLTQGAYVVQGMDDMNITLPRSFNKRDFFTMRNSSGTPSKIFIHKSGKVFVGEETENSDQALVRELIGPKTLGEMVGNRRLMQFIYTDLQKESGETIKGRNLEIFRGKIADFLVLKGISIDQPISRETLSITPTQGGQLRVMIVSERRKFDVYVNIFDLGFFGGDYFDFQGKMERYRKVKNRISSLTTLSQLFQDTELLQVVGELFNGRDSLLTDIETRKISILIINHLKQYGISGNNVVSMYNSGDSIHLTIRLTNGTTEDLEIKNNGKVYKNGLEYRIAKMSDTISKGAPDDYRLSLENDRTLVANPPRKGDGRESGTRSATFSRTKEGGFKMGVEQPFQSFEWYSGTIIDLMKYMGKSSSEKTKLEEALASNGFDSTALNVPRKFLVWKTPNDAGVLFFSKNSKGEPGMVSICEEVRVLNMNPNLADAPTISLRKPVIYIYPTKKQKVSVKLTLKGAKLAVEYPKSQKGIWSVTADVDGTLTDIATKKKYSSIFWEASMKDVMDIDLKNAFCVTGKDAESFLEDTLTTLGLSVRERNEFIVYWLPFMEANKYSLVEFKTTEYTDIAKLDITPSPESLIRVFMVFKKVPKKVKTGNPKLVKAKRKGYAVVEWGGSNLDEGKNIK